MLNKLKKWKWNAQRYSPLGFMRQSWTKVAARSINAFDVDKASEKDASKPHGPADFFTASYKAEPQQSAQGGCCTKTTQLESNQSDKISHACFSNSYRIDKISPEEEDQRQKQESARVM